jgi:hypothetical protein
MANIVYHTVIAKKKGRTPDARARAPWPETRYMLLALLVSCAHCCDAVPPKAGCTRPVRGGQILWIFQPGHKSPSF